MDLLDERETQRFMACCLVTCAPAYARSRPARKMTHVWRRILFVRDGFLYSADWLTADLVVLSQL